MFENLKIKYFKKESGLFEECACAKDASKMFYLTEKLPNPDKILRQSGRGFQTLRDLKNNYQVGTCIESRKAGVTSKNWKLDKQFCSDKEYNFYLEIFKFIDVYRLIEEILEAPLFGYNPIEITYESDGNYVIPTAFTSKPQEWFYYNTVDKNFYFDSKTKDVCINEHNPKFLIPIHRSSFFNPYGECLLSRCFWNVVFMQGGMEFWVQFTEKYGTPFMVGKYDRSMSKEERDDLFKMLKKMVQNAIGVIPKDGTIDIINPDKTGSNTVYKDLITKCENNISKVILGQTLTTDVSQNGGSYALSKTHQSVREDLIQNDIRLCEKTINNLIYKIHAINFENSEYPKFKLYDEQGVDQSLAERDNKLRNLGVKFTKQYIKKTYGYEDADFVLEGDN